ncbi:MAG: hypothetical protein ACK5GN_12115 [Pseudomonadota bacterium]|jgi:hypothetical protein
MKTMHYHPNTMPFTYQGGRTAIGKTFNLDGIEIYTLFHWRRL